YVDGELVDDSAAEGAMPSTGPLSIGCSQEGEDNFKGDIDEVRIYNRALGEAELRLTMNAGFPVAITEAPTEVEANDAILNGTVDANGGETEYLFEYGPTKSYGSVAMGEEIGNDREATKISEAAIDLAPETAYHYRLVANSPVGTTYGKDQALTTAERTMTVGEEEELTDAEDKRVLIASESKAGPGDFYGMMWTGDLKKMREKNIWEAVERSGSKVVRFAIYPDLYLQTEIDKAFNEAAKRGITVLPYFGAGPFPKAGTKKRENWITYAKKMVQKYGPDSSFSPPVKAWEIWNEPNMSHVKEVNNSVEEQGEVKPAEFAVFFKEMAEALRSSKGEVQVLTPGLYGYRGGGCHPECHLTPRVFLERMDQTLSQLEYSNAYNAISLHPYVFKIGELGRQHAPRDAADVKRVSKAIKSVITAVHALKKGKPLWITELGFPLANPDPENKGKVPPVTESIQELLVDASFSMIQSNRKRLNISHAFYYNIQDDSKPRWDYHSGLLTLKGKARPAWNPFSKLAGGKACPHAPC
ncbi:MAG TPA: LamG-like jellyroll fold domain-containing protein, partial [Bryobacteraceae bacterium]|nr:LamG-like jellyroll fold domain-containing protein [Bryobacteraceae bacterium]